MSKLGLIIKREYMAKVRNKSFVIMTFLSPILMVGMVVLIAYLTQVNDSETRVIAVLNESEHFRTHFNPEPGLSYVRFLDLDLEKAKDSVQSLEYYGLLYLPDKEDIIGVSNHTFLYTEDAPSSGVLRKIEAVFEEEIRALKLGELGVTPEEYRGVRSQFDINTETFSGEMNIKGVNEIKAIVGGGFGYLIMMFIIIYGGFVMRSVIEEKTSRIIEVIISSVKPFQLMLGKIIGNSLAGITQFLIWMIVGSLLLTACLLFLDVDPAILFNSAERGPEGLGALSQAAELDDTALMILEESLRIPWLLLSFFFIIYFIFGYLIYSSIYAAIGAAVDNETDTQQFIFPIVLPLMLAIYVGFFSVFNNPHGPIAVGFSLFPLTSPIVMMMRLAGGIGEGGVAIWQLVLSLVLLVITFVAIVWLAGKIYRIGILMYGKKPSYKELFKWLRY